MNPTLVVPAPLPRPVRIAGTGAYAPERVLTNRDLEKMVHTTDEWIVTRTGMRERHIAADDQAASDLGAEAARRALADAGLRADDVQMIVAATITPDHPFPNTGCMIQHKIGARNAFCMGLEAACSGFVYGVETARHFIASGAIETALIVGAEKMSALLDWRDRSTCVLFGDGAGAAVLRPAHRGRGLIASALGSDGSLGELLFVPAGGSRRPASPETVAAGEHYLRMNGREVYKHAVTNMVRAARAALHRAGLTVGDVRWFIPHQANLRIIGAIAERLGAPMDRFVINVERYGNTSGASVPIALDEASRDGRLRNGDIVMMLVFGGGFTWGATLLEWEK